MNVVVYGATGRSGSRILQELTLRGHQVTAVARDTANAATRLVAASRMTRDVDTIASIIQDADAVVVSAYSPPAGRH